MPVQSASPVSHSIGLAPLANDVSTSTNCLLPVELWKDIIGICASSDLVTAPASSISIEDHYQLVYRLRLVCVLWNKIILDAPSLWCLHSPSLPEGVTNIAI